MARTSPAKDHSSVTNPCPGLDESAVASRGQSKRDPTSSQALIQGRAMPRHALARRTLLVMFAPDETQECQGEAIDWSCI